MIDKIPSSVTSLEWTVMDKPGLSDEQLRKITKNCPLLEKVKLTIDENVTEDVLKAFLQKFSQTLINLDLEGLDTCKKTIFEDLEFTKLVYVCLQAETFEDGVINALNAPHLETLQLDFAKGNPVLQNLDHLLSLYIACPEELINQVLQNCLNLETLQIELHEDKKLSLNPLKTIFFQMPCLKKFTESFDIEPEVLNALVKAIEDAKTFSSQLSLIVLKNEASDIIKDELLKAFNKKHLSPNILYES